jgi:DNA-binding NtrC family response regulator
MARILIVENDVILRYVLTGWLRHKDHDVLEAASADEAAVILSSALAIDLVVTDIEMPGSMNGIDLADHIRIASPKLPVILVSGEPFVERLRTVSVSAFFPKPYDMQRLSDFIATLVPQADAIPQKRWPVGDE